MLWGTGTINAILDFEHINGATVLRVVFPMN